jgi:hypothetical protein
MFQDSIEKLAFIEGEIFPDKASRDRIIGALNQEFFQGIGVTFLTIQAPEVCSSVEFFL